jgi:DNA polymerase-3 subunit epsilon
MMEVGYTREHIAQNFEHLPKFCTMLFTRKSKDIFGGYSYLRLNQLYESLFHKPIAKLHDALFDAEATKACFFELVKRGEITDSVIAKQIRMSRRRWELPAWIVLVLATLVALLIMAAGLYLVF